MKKTKSQPKYVYRLWVEQNGAFCHCRLAIGMVTETTDIKAKWEECLRCVGKDLPMWRARYESCVGRRIEPKSFEAETVLEFRWQSDRESGFFRWYAPRFEAELGHGDKAIDLLRRINGDGTTTPERLVMWLESHGITYVRHVRDIGGDIAEKVDLVALKVKEPD